MNHHATLVLTKKLVHHVTALTLRIFSSTSSNHSRNVTRIARILLFLHPANSVTHARLLVRLAKTYQRSAHLVSKAHSYTKTTSVCPSAHSYTLRIRMSANALTLEN